MSIWYYADRDNARQGPVEAAELVRLRLRGALDWDTLVWRDGMAEWRPMREFAAELAQADDRAGAVAGTAGAALAVGEPAPAPALAAAAAGVAQVEPASPYAPPRAAVSADAAVVTGGEVVQAGFWKRFAAMVIDGLVTGVATWAVQIPLLMMAGIGMGSELMSLGGSIGLVLLSYGIGLAIPLLYFSWMHSSGSQASLGKMAVGIKVTRGTGERISFWRALGRYVAYVVSVVFSFGVGGLVSALTAGLTQRKQALHDMVCDTLVVDKWAFTDRPDLQRRELGVVTWIILVLGLGLLALFILGIVLVATMPGFSK
ncbi:MAG: RDD family protein [Planctomycetes bacterium]|nr:RDD family protein [Planctomycetota bacterium]